MKQLTLRGFDDELARRLEAIARGRSISLNRAALLLMRRGAGLAPAAERRVDWLTNDGPAEARTIGSALDKFVGVWSEEEEREFLRSIEKIDQVDPELWE